MADTPSQSWLPHYCPECKRQWHCVVPGCAMGTDRLCGKHQNDHAAEPSSPVHIHEAAEALAARLGSSSDVAANPEVSAVLLELLNGVRSVLAHRFVGMYLQGSLATGDFDVDSDIDFVVVVDGDVTDDELPALQRMHSRIYELDSRWSQHLEGWYVPATALRRHHTDVQPHLYLDHGNRTLERFDYDNELLFRFVLREHGIVLAGPDPKSLMDPIAPSALQQWMIELLDLWMAPLLADPTPLNNRWRQPHIVLSICRILYTLQYGAVVSKLKAVEWAKTYLDARWVNLIDRAWVERREPFLKARQTADPDQAAATVEFVRYAIDLSRRGPVPRTVTTDLGRHLHQAQPVLLH